MDSLPFLPCLNLNSNPESKSIFQKPTIRPPPETRAPYHPRTSKPTMGGCASKPKEFDGPADTPISSEKPHLETTAQSNTNGGESQIEKSTVDRSEPEKEAQTSSSEAASAETDAAKTVKPTEDDVKAVNKNAEDKVEATTKQPVKEAGAADHKSNDAPIKEEVKSDALLASL